MSIHNGHRKRIREKFLNYGFNSMHPHEILEFLLFFSSVRGDMNPLAHSLINHYGSLSSVFDAPYEDLLKFDGIGENTAILLKSIPHFSRAYMESSNQNIVLDSTESAGIFLLPKFVGRIEETVILTLLDNKLSVIRSEVIFVGSVNSAHVNMRKIIELCIKYNASSALLAHNHPNGIAIPSSADISTTIKLKEALLLINVNLIDHIIVASSDFVSLADSMYI